MNKLLIIKLLFFWNLWFRVVSLLIWFKIVTLEKWVKVIKLLPHNWFWLNFSLQLCYLIFFESTTKKFLTINKRCNDKKIYICIKVDMEKWKVTVLTTPSWNGFKVEEKWQHIQWNFPFCPLLNSSHPLNSGRILRFWQKYIDGSYEKKLL